MMKKLEGKMSFLEMGWLEKREKKYLSRMGGVNNDEHFDAEF